MKIDHKMRVPFNHHMHTRKVLFGHANVNKKTLFAQNVRTYVFRLFNITKKQNNDFPPF